MEIGGSKIIVFEWGSANDVSSLRPSQLQAVHIVPSFCDEEV